MVGLVSYSVPCSTQTLDSCRTRNDETNRWIWRILGGKTKRKEYSPSRANKELLSALCSSCPKSCWSFEEIGNPFLEEKNDLLRLDTRDTINPAVADSMPRPRGQASNSTSCMYMIDCCTDQYLLWNQSRRTNWHCSIDHQQERNPRVVCKFIPYRLIVLCSHDSILLASLEIVTYKISSVMITKLVPHRYHKMKRLEWEQNLIFWGV